MLGSGSFATIAWKLTGSLGFKLAPSPAAQVHGGCINECYRWESDRGSLFVKIADTRKLGVFKAEAAGLEELRSANAVRVPRVLAVGTVEDCAYLALEWIEFGRPLAATDARLGEQLAQQHRTTAQRFGWSRDNTIGSTPQLNGWMQDWTTFFRERRLRYQLDLARKNGYAGHLQQQGAELLENLQGLFSGYSPAPSLLHGDLWGGNWGAATDGAPIIFDPATYYGDREADIAMTHLFGGFGKNFYAAYEAAWPLDPGASARSTLYNLYHVLNHLNLFGADYLAQAESMTDRLLAALGR